MTISKGVKRMKIYKRFLAKTAFIKDEMVYATSEDDYKIKNAYRAASKFYAGMFGYMMQMLSKKNLFYIIPRTEIENADYLVAKGNTLGNVQSFDGLSISSINRPWSRIMRTSTEKCAIEQWVNPFALITDGTRNINTFLFQMPVTKLDNSLLDMYHKSKLPVKGFGHELFGIPGITVFMDKSSKTDELVESITGMPISLEGDGLVVSPSWAKKISVFDHESHKYVDLPFPFKGQGVARSKGITIAKIKEKVEVEVNGKRYPVDVIMNTQGKRKNKVANIVASGMRFRKYNGETIKEIDTRNKEQLTSIAKEYSPITGILYVNDQPVGQVVVGINKFYIDLTHNMQPKIDKSRINYLQAQTISKLLEYPGLDRMVKIDTKPKVMDKAKQIEQVELYENLIDGTNTDIFE